MLPPPAPVPARSRAKAMKWAGGALGSLAALAGIGSYIDGHFGESDIPTAQAATVNGCPSYHPPSTTARLVICDNGPRVTELQEDLSFLGYTVNVDSDFGKGTQSAVNQFEQQHDL